MIRRALLCQSMFLLVGAAAHATTIVNTTSFAEDIIYGTDTFETAGGAVLTTVQYVAWGDKIPSDIAADIFNDPSFPAPQSGMDLSDPAGAAFIKSTVSQAALTNDLDFVTGQLPTVFLTSASPSVYVGMVSDVTGPEAFLELLFPGYVVNYPVSVNALGNNSYETGYYDAPTNTLYDGTVTFAAFEIDIISQPVSATPEPSTLFLLVPCSLGLMLAARRKERCNP